MNQLTDNSTEPQYQDADIEMKPNKFNTNHYSAYSQPNQVVITATRSNDNNPFLTTKKLFPDMSNGDSVEIKPQYPENEKALDVRIAHIPRHDAYNCPNIWVFYLILLVFEMGIIAFFSVFYRIPENIRENNETGLEQANTYILNNQNFFHTTQLVLILSIGLIQAYLKHNSWTSVAIALFVGVFGMQLGILYITFWEDVFVGEFPKKEITFRLLMKGEMNSFTTLITLHALVGKLTVPQCIVLAIFEGFFSAFNYALNIICLRGIDDGGSLYIYCFGGLFGLGVSMTLFCCCSEEEVAKINKSRITHEGGSYFSVVIGFIGTCLFWVLLPYINGALAPLTMDYNYDSLKLDDAFSNIFRYRGMINTFFALIGSTVAVLICSAFINCGRVSANHLIITSVSGGIAVAGSGCYNNYLYGAILCGFLTGIISICLYSYIRPILVDNNLFDTLGSGSVFGFPGFLGGILTSIIVSSIKEEGLIALDVFKDRSLNEESGIVIACTFITIGLSLSFGAITGLILSFLPLGENYRHFVDSEHFENESEPFAEHMPLRGFRKDMVINEVELKYIN